MRANRIVQISEDVTPAQVHTMYSFCRIFGNYEVKVKTIEVVEGGMHLEFNNPPKKTLGINIISEAFVSLRNSDLVDWIPQNLYMTYLDSTENSIRWKIDREWVPPTDSPNQAESIQLLNRISETRAVIED